MSNFKILNGHHLVDTRTAAGILAKHPAVLADWRHANKGPRFIRMGRSIRYRVSDLLEWIDSHTVETRDS